MPRGRKEGSVNAPKDVAYYKRKLKEHGIDPRQLIDGEPQPAAAQIPVDRQPQSLKIDTGLPPDKVQIPTLKGDTYRCGACNHILDDMFTNCPYCGIPLTWE